MFEKLMKRLGFVPESEVNKARVASRALAHTVTSQQVEIDRMAARYQRLQRENAGVVGLLMSELAAARS